MQGAYAAKQQAGNQDAHRGIVAENDGRQGHITLSRDHALGKEAQLAHGNKGAGKPGQHAAVEHGAIPYPVHANAHGIAGLGVFAHAAHGKSQLGLV